MNCKRCLQVDGKDSLVIAAPVQLIEKDNSITKVCYVSRCMECGWIAHYGDRFLYKLQGNVPDFHIEYWQELRRNGISPEDFQAAIFNLPTDKQLVLDGRNYKLEYDWEQEPNPHENFFQYVERYLDQSKLFAKRTKENLLKLFKQHRGIENDSEIN